MTEAPYKKKLIEVALPLDAINAEAAREKSIRHGHPSTLHPWWARRPLAACRAVLFAQLVDDPSAHPEKFPTEEAQDQERQRLFEIIEELVLWENCNNEEVLEKARREINRSCGGNPPAVLDPFAGGGAIPLEAQRLGLETHASDLNPVAVLINKAMIEIPPKWAGMKPVHPEAENRGHWSGAEGLAEDVRRYGQWMRDEAFERIGHLYPKATLEDGSEANIIAWIWARTVTCPNPACGATMPLVRSFWLGKKKGKEAWVIPVAEGSNVRFEIGTGTGGPLVDGTVGRRGASCICCESPVSLNHIRSEGRDGRMGQQLMAVVAEGNRRRIYLEPTAKDVEIAETERPVGCPEGLLPINPRDFKTPNYGMTEWADLFTNRQLVALTTFSELVKESRIQVVKDAQNAGLEVHVAADYADSVVTYLAFALDRITSESCTISTWVSSPKMEQVASAFGRQALQMTWDFAESNVFFKSAGSFLSSTKRVSKVLEKFSPSVDGKVLQKDARQLDTPAVIATDPPYYDNIGYADLSDFFYVWLRQSLKDVYPDLFATMVTPKSTELIATPYRHEGSKKAAERYFEDGFVEVFERCREVNPEGFPMTLFYAFKQTEISEEGTVTTGWSTMLEGLLAAGWMVTATWPMRTERPGRMNDSGANALASSVLLACRQRSETSGITDRQGVIRALRDELRGPLNDLQKSNIAPVDLRQAAIGPGMAVFSRFAKVVEPDGGAMRVSTALGLINQVLDQVLNAQDAEFDSETRWAIQWFSEFFEDEGPFGKAEQLALAMDVSIEGMVSSGILESGGGKVRLLAREELSTKWDPVTDDRTPVWEACQHLVKRLESDSEESAGRLLRSLGGLGESAQLLAYRLYTICETKRPGLAGPYNALAASWTEIQRISHQVFEPATVVEQETLDL
jgi:putative DNA methylase